MIAIFIDGPLSGETRNIGARAYPIYNVVLPERITVCECDPDYPEEMPEPPEAFQYHVVALGDAVALYSKYKDDTEALVASLRNWVFTDFSNVDRIYYGCRHKRAFQ